MLKPPVVVIHSLNSLGAEKMKVHLSSIGIKHYRIEFFDILRSDLIKLSKAIEMNLQ